MSFWTPSLEVLNPYEALKEEQEVREDINDPKFLVEKYLCEIDKLNEVVAKLEYEARKVAEENARLKECIVKMTMEKCGVKND